MPYIKREQQLELESREPDDEGELNYAITMLLINFWTSRAQRNYERINQIIGAIEGAKLEFYRRIAAPYEDKKMKQNGDVYEGLQP